MRTFILTIILLTAFIIVGTIESGDSPTEQDIQDYIQHCGIEHPEIVFKQIILETDHMTSRLYREDHNLFGMKYAYSRPTTAIDRNRNRTAVYYSWKHSIIDYKLWQDKYYKGGDYYKFLSRIYAEDPVYTRKLRGVK